MLTRPIYVEDVRDRVVRILIGLEALSELVEEGRGMASCHPSMQLIKRADMKLFKLRNEVAELWKDLYLSTLFREELVS